jgi:hypothetical protein
MRIAIDALAQLALQLLQGLRIGWRKSTTIGLRISRNPGLNRSNLSVSCWAWSLLMLPSAAFTATRPVSDSSEAASGLS